MDGTSVGTWVGLGVGLRVGSGFGVGAGVGNLVGFAVVGAGVGLSDGLGVGFVVNKYGFVRISCSMRSRPLRCCMRQRALRAASSAPPHATTRSNDARRMVAAQFVLYCSALLAGCRRATPASRNAVRNCSQGSLTVWCPSFRFTPCWLPMAASI